MEEDGHGRDPLNHTIFTCRFVVMAVIIGADLLGLHADKFVTVHNCMC